MTRDETKIVINSIMVCYPKGLMPEISREMVDMWHTLLQDLDYREAVTAVAALISENPQYPPTIGQIRGRLARAKLGGMSSEEAFSLIRKAVRDYGSYREQEAIASLPAELQTVVKRHGFGYFCEMSRDNITTYAAQFRREWDAIAEEQTKTASIPAHINKQLEAMRPIRPQIAAESEITYE